MRNTPLSRPISVEDWRLKVTYSRVKIVDSFDELVSTAFGPEVNALCWARNLPGNFDEVAARFSDDEIISLDEETLRALTLGADGRVAANAMLADRRLLEDRGLQPSLEWVPRYLRDATSTVPTDVYSFHADRAPVEAYTYLCSYNTAATEGLRNDQAQRIMDIDSTRTEILRLYAEDGAGDFDAYVKENCFDLHYRPLPGATPFSFGIGNLWRIAVEYPGSPVPPCLHRAPETADGQPPRLLLIS